jgi:hypothetical protein
MLLVGIAHPTTRFFGLYISKSLQRHPNPDSFMEKLAAIWTVVKLYVEFQSLLYSFQSITLCSGYLEWQLRDVRLDILLQSGDGE